MERKGEIMIVGLLIAILVVALFWGISWIVTCGIVKLITICFGLTFSWSVATGIWLCLALLNLFLTNSK